MPQPSTNKPTRIRLLIADIDGTLVTKEKLLTPMSVEAVERLDKAGILFGITTGRPPAGARMLVEPLPDLKFIAGFNGAVVVRRDFSVFKENLLAAILGDANLHCRIGNLKRLRQSVGDFGYSQSFNEYPALTAELQTTIDIYFVQAAQVRTVVYRNVNEIGTPNRVLSGD